MRFPHDIVILSPTGTDDYGNVSTSFDTATETPAVAFIVQRSSMSGGEQTAVTLALLPPDTVLLPTDRIRRGSTVYAVIGDVITASSPSRSVLKTATLQEVPGG